MDVLVVGGEHSFIQDTLGPRFAEYDIQFTWHWDWYQKPGDILPSGCKGVVVFTDMVGHALSNAALGLARGMKMPCALITRQMTKALPILRAAGLIAPEPKTLGGIPPDDLLEVVRQTIEFEAVTNHRFPRRDEVMGPVKAAFGPDVVVSDGILKKARGLVAAKVGRLPVESDTLQAWARLVVEDHFENTEEAARILCEVVAGESEVVPATAVLHTAIETARGQLRALWERGEGSVERAYTQWRARNPGDAEPEKVFGKVPNAPWIPVVEPTPEPVVEGQPQPVNDDLPADPWLLALALAAEPTSTSVSQRQQVASLCGKLGVATKKITKLEGERDELAGKLALVLEKLSSKDGDLSEMQIQKELAEQERDNALGMCETLRTEVADRNVTIGALTQKLHRRIEEHNDAVRTLGVARMEKETADEAKEMAEEERDSALGVCKDLRAEKAATEQALELARLSVQALEARVAAMDRMARVPMVSGGAGDSILSLVRAGMDVEVKPRR